MLVLMPARVVSMIGTVIGGRYEITDRIGGGGMGVVYKARHSLMERTVALKVLHPNLTEDDESLKRFLESRAAVHHDPDR